jgi:uncharacterized protein (TIGR03435 family)
VIVPLAAGALQPPPPLAMPARAMPPRETAPRFATSVDVRAVTYALVVARADGRLGPELRRVRTARSDVGAGAPPAHPVLPREISADAITLPRLAELLASVLGGDVEDRTGLTGDFTIRLIWTSADPRGPSLFDAVEQQLGLRLVPLQSGTQ